MTESHNSTNQMNDDDEDKLSNSPMAAPPPQDQSGSFQIASNPEQFFQTSIDVMNSPDSNRAPSVQSQQPSPNLQAAGQGANDFFNRQESHQAQSFAGSPQAVPGGTDKEDSSSAFDSFQQGAPVTRPADPNRLPSGFFDNSAQASTTAGAASPAQAQPRNDYDRPMQNPPRGTAPGGLTAEQAFFFGREPGPSPSPQQNAAPSSFHNFYQESLPNQEQPFSPAPNTTPTVTPQTQYQQLADSTAAVQTNTPIPEPNRQAPLSRPAESPVPDFQPAIEAQPQTQQPVIQPRRAPNDQSGLPPTRLNLPPKVRPTDKPKSSQAAKASPPPPPPPVAKKKRPPIRETTNDTDTTDSERSSRVRGENTADKMARFDKLITPETTGMLMFAVHEAKLILLDPRKFFKEMPQRGNIAEPMLFMLICTVAGGLLAGIIRFNLLITIQFVMGSLLTSGVLSFTSWKAANMMGSQEEFGANFRVIAYSQAALIVAGLKFSFLGSPIPGYLTLFIATMLMMRLQIIGMMNVHDLPPNKIILLLLIPTIVVALIRFKLGLL